MIRCLPLDARDRPAVTRIDWMISLSLRSTVRLGSCTQLWVEQPLADELLGDRARRRGRVPRRVSRPAATMPIGSKPGVVPERSGPRPRSSRRRATGGMSSNVDDLAVELAESRELDLAGPVVDDRLLRELDLLELGRVLQSSRQGQVRADHDDGRNDPGECQRPEDGKRGSADSPEASASPGEVTLGSSTADGFVAGDGSGCSLHRRRMPDIAVRQRASSPAQPLRQACRAGAVIRRSTARGRPNGRRRAARRLPPRTPRVQRAGRREPPRAGPP